MTNFCGNCGNKINVGEKFCVNCGEKVDSISEDNRTSQPLPTSLQQTEQKPNYPIVSRTNNVAIVELFTGVIFEAVIIYMLISVLSDDPFFFVIWVVLAIGCLVWIVLVLAELKVSCYQLNCPICKQATIFPVNRQSYNCTCCNKKLIMDSGTIRPID